MTQCHGRFTTVLAVTALCVGLVGSAIAFDEVSHNAEYEILLPSNLHNPYLNQTAATFEAGEALEATMSSTIGGNWTVRAWNNLSNTPLVVTGRGLNLETSIATDESAEAAARQIVATHSEVFGADETSLRVFAVRRVPGTAVVTFQQMHNGIDVWGGTVDVTMHGNGRVGAMGSSYFGDIAVSTSPAISHTEATNIAKSAVPFNEGTDEIQGTPELLVVPVAVSATEVEHHLVWRVRVSTEEPLAIWVTHVDAHSRNIVWRYNDIHFLDYFGDSEADVQDNTYCDGIATLTNGWVDVTVSGLGTVTAGSDGSWNAGEGGTGNRTVTAELYGPWINVNNTGSPDASYTGTATGGVSHTVLFDDSNADRDERDVFESITEIHDFFELFDAGYSYTNTRITGIVKSSSGICPCNAFWNGNINLCAAGGGCANTGEIQGVSHHEFGHGIQDNLIGGQGNEGLGEGNSDIIANYMTRESMIGRGFQNCTVGIRDSDNNLQYPQDLGSIHHSGQIIAGFNWDNWMLFENQFGQTTGTIMAATRWHFARKLWPSQVQNQPGQVLHTFMADDLPVYGGDGDLDNGTPNYDILCEAAQNHNFACPEILVGVIVGHTPPESQAGTDDVVLTCSVISTEAPVDDSTVKLMLSTNGGGFVQVDMLPNGFPSEYSATVSGFDVPTEFEYYMTADDNLGNNGTSPRDAPASLHGFDAVTVWEPFEANNGGWSVNEEGTDDATTGMWDHGDPQQTISQPGDDHTVSGTDCWVTAYLSGGSDGANDVDNGSTSLYSASFNTAGSTIAKIKYWRWYSNNQGGGPNADTWVVQVRNNSGPWVDVERNQTDQNEWVLREFDLYAEFGNDLGVIEVKFIASDLATPSLVEACVDDFALLADLGSAVDVEIDTSPAGVPAANYLAGAKPNPFNPQTTIRYGLTGDAKVRLEIYDVNGRIVRSLVNTSQTAGNYAIVWDGRDNGGRALSSGVYYSRLTTDSFAKSQKLTLLK